MTFENDVNSFMSCKGTYAEKLYRVLCSSKYDTSDYEKRDLGEDITLISSVICGYWKPRYLVNHATKCGYVFMNESESLQNVEHRDINWLSLRDLPEICKRRARFCYAGYPTYIYDFHNGVAEVEWQLQPDGRYWMDEDGFGMTPETRISVYGFIDTSCKVVVPFQTVQGQAEIDLLRLKAEEIVSNRK